MQVDIRNFEEIYPRFLNELKNCSFVAIDAEYSGLEPPPGMETEIHSMFDSAERRYQKAKSCSCYVICQFGIAIFRRLGESSCFETSCYNFYLNPASFEDFAKDDHVVWELASVMFLKEFHFDFDRVFNYGIPYLNQRKLKEFKHFLEKRSQQKKNNVDEVIAKSKQMGDHNQSSHQEGEKSDEELIKYYTGFSRIINALSASHKPIVGHNMYTDLILTYHCFVDDLPNSFTDFKENVHQTFPYLYDTKAIAQGMRTVMNSGGNAQLDMSYLSNSSLCALYKNTSDPPGRNKPLISLSHQSRSYEEGLNFGKREDLELMKSTKCHEAGFDACVTGAVFTQLIYISWQYELSMKALPPNRTFGDIFLRVQRWINRINLSRARMPHVNFGGTDPPSHRPPWLCVSVGGFLKIGGYGIGPGSDLDLKLIIRHCNKIASCEGIYTSSDKKKALIACCNHHGAFQIQKYLKREGYGVYEIPVPNDDGILHPFPWGRVFACVAVFWSFAALSIGWKTGALKQLLHVRYRA